MQSQNSYNNLNKPQHKDFIDSTTFCKPFFYELFEKTFQGVGIQNAKKMAPKNTFLQIIYTLQSFIGFSFTQKLKDNLVLKDQQDFKPPVIDNLAVQQIDSQKQPHSNSMPTIVQQATSTRSKLKSLKSGTDRSIRSRKFTQISQQMPLIKSKQLTNFQKLPQVANQFDFSQDPQLNKIRLSFFNIQRQNLQRTNELDALKQKSLVQKQRNEKIVKQMKKITYDYEGKLFGQGSGITQPQKLMFLSNKFGNIKKSIMASNKQIEETKIQTNRKKDQRSDKKDFKQVSMFRQKAHSIIQSIQNSKGISAGVKIIQQLAQKKSITKQNPLKKPSIHSLAEFKNNVKQSRFRQYHTTSLNKQKSQLNISTLNNEQTSRTEHDKNGQNSKNKSFNKQYKSRSSYSLIGGNKNKSMDILQDFQSSRVDMSILGSIDQKKKTQKVKYRGLPFIKTKGYKAIDIDSQKSFKLILDEQGQHSKQKIRSRILINDINLLKTTLQQL